MLYTLYDKEKNAQRTGGRGSRRKNGKKMTRLNSRIIAPVSLGESRKAAEGKPELW